MTKKPRGPYRPTASGLPSAHLTHAAYNPPEQSAHWPASEFGDAPITVGTKGQDQ